MDDLTREFLIESQEGLDRMERCLTELEKRPHDADLVAEIFRSVHTIKGTTGFLGLKRLETLAHAGENLLGLLREGKLVADGEIVTGLLHLLDALRGILRTVETQACEGEGDDAGLISQLDQLRKVARQCSPQKLQTGAGASSAMESQPKQSAAPAAVHEAWEETPGTAAPDANVQQETEAGSLSRGGVRAGSAAESTLRVDIALLNRMMNLVGELVLTRNQILQATSADSGMTLLSRRLDMVTADLRESVMKARMQPVSNLFSKMPRLVRDLCRTLGRRVRLEMEGQETELDKSLLEAIKDPLTHAVRNALDHGVELPEVRQAAGKNPEGTLRLRAVQEGSHVIIEISDDGAGISVEKIRNKALERELITAERAALLPDRELLQLIFVPGFSTAASVTNVSGRGVGMDVVRTNVERIGGKVEIDSHVGKGTTLRLRIPLTLAIVPALIVRSLNQSFALPQGALSELVHVPPGQAAAAIEWMEGSPLYRLRGKLLPLVFLDRLLMPAVPHKRPMERDNFIAVLDADGRCFGLVVDGLADPEEIVVKPLSSAVKEIGIYSGATVLGNAELALILDPGAIAIKSGIALSAEEETEPEAEEAGAAGRVDNSDYLVMEAGGRQAAVPLAEVLRIENLPVSRVESIGCQPVLNLDGQLLAVQDLGGVLAAARASAEGKIVVVVCAKAGRQVGIAVSHVLDVAAGADLFEAGCKQPANGVTLLKNRVTAVVELAGAPSAPGISAEAKKQAEYAEATT